MADRDIQILIQATDRTGAAIASINKNLGWLGGSITKLAVQFSAMSTSVQAAWGGLQKGLEWAEMAAKARQAEVSFRQVAATAGESADEILDAMKKASAGTIDDSDLMQKAVKGITQGLKGEELIRLTEAARVAARTTGEDIGSAFDKIVDAVANKTPRALKEMGMVSKEQMTIFEQATRAGVEEITLFDMVIANATVRQAQFGAVTDNAAEAIQRIKAQIKGAGEALAGTFLTALEKVQGVLGVIGVVLSYAAVGFFKMLQGAAAFSAWNEGRAGNKGASEEWRKKAEEYKVEAESYKLLAAEYSGQVKTAFGGGSGGTKGLSEGDDFSTRHKEKFLETAKRSVKDIEDKWKALIKNAEDLKKPKKKREEQFEDVGAMTKYYAEIEQKSEDYEKKMTEARSTELQKRYNEVDEWEKKQAQSKASLYSAGILDFTKFEADKIEIAAIAAEKRRKIAAENARAIREAEIQGELSGVDYLEKSHGISKGSAIEQRIALNKELLAIQEEYLASINKSKDPSSWYAQADAIAKTRDNLLSLNEAMKEQSGTLWDGLVEGMQRYAREQLTAFQSGLEMAKSITSGMESAFTSFFDTASEKFMDFGELAKSILRTIYMELVKTLIIKQVMAGITGMFHEGGVVMHQGGLVMHAGGLVGRSDSGGGYVPRYHIGGLSGDERPAILQTGEGVLSRRGMANLGALNSGSAGGGGNVDLKVEVINQSSTPVKGEQGPIRFDGKQWVTSIFLSDMDSYGPMRAAVQGIK